MTCPGCGGVMVEVDNPHRYEIRHRRGSTCPWWRCQCGEWTDQDTHEHVTVAWPEADWPDADGPSEDAIGERGE